jgi:hypothetical protein
MFGAYKRKYMSTIQRIVVRKGGFVLYIYMRGREGGVLGVRLGCVTACRLLLYYQK